MQRELWRAEAYDVGFHADQYLGAAIALDAATVSGASAANADSVRNARYASALEEMRRRLLNEPGVTGVTFVDRLPRSEHRERLVQVEDESRTTLSSDAAPVPVSRDSLSWVSTATIDPGYFDVLDVPLLAGREFNSGDVSSDAPVLIVDEVFVKQVLHGRSAVGQRVRFIAPASAGAKVPEAPGPWYQVVGVAKDLGLTSLTHRGRDPGVYLPADLRKDGPLFMAVHVKGDPMSFVPRVRAVGSAVDPALRLSELERLNEVYSDVLWFLRLWIRITLGLTAIALLLSLAGIYAVMSFTVARRTREIGIRVALGANARTMVAQIFRRPLTQVSIGVLLGSMLAGLLMLTEMGGGTISVTGIGLMLIYGVVILTVCLLACVVPTRRALSVEPMEALRVE
jgi:putative ABC transport system permease protein